MQQSVKCHVTLQFSGRDYPPLADSISYRKVFERTDSVSRYVFLAVAFQQIRLIEILHLTALSRLTRFPSTRRSIWRNIPVPVCGCNYFHLRRRSLVQSFLRKDVPPLKLLEANSFPRGNFCEASRVAPLPSLSSSFPPSPGYSYLDTPSQRERN